MPQILFDANLITPDEINANSGLIYRIQFGELKYPNIKRLSGISYFNTPAYRAKINEKDRLIYTYIDYQGEKTLCILAVNNHNYKRLKRQLGSTSPGHIDILELQDHAPQALQEKERPANPPASKAELKFLAAVPHKEGMLVWDEQQRLCHSHLRPVIFSGPPGTGKTSVLYNNMLFHLNAKATEPQTKKPRLPILYISPSEKLVKESRADYKKRDLGYKIKFITWLEYLKVLYPEKKPVCELDFKTWLERLKWQENAREIHYELSLIVALGVEKYHQLRSRQCHFADNEAMKKKLVDLLQAWQSHLDQQNAFDPMICLLPEGKQYFAEVYCDETQNLPPTALLSLIRLTSQFAAGLDSEQCLLSSPYIHNCLKELLYKYHQSYSEISLARTWRCPPEIIKVGNQLMKAKYSIDGSGNRREYQEVESTLPKGSGLASWVQAKHVAPLKTLCLSATTVVIVAEINEELRLTIQKELGTNNILTPKDAIGLEFENVILYNPISQRPCLHELAQQKILTNAGMNLEQWNELNALYVSLTRAQKSVYLVDEIAQKRWHHFTAMLFGELPVNQFSAPTVQQEAEKPEKQWLDLAWKYFKEELIEQAIHILRFHLNYDEQKIAAFIKAAMPEETSSAIPTIVPRDMGEKEDDAKTTSKIKPRSLNPSSAQAKPATPITPARKDNARPIKTSALSAPLAPSVLNKTPTPTTPVKIPNEITLLLKKTTANSLKKFLKNPQAKHFLFNIPVKNNDCLFRVLCDTEASRAALFYCMSQWASLVDESITKKILCPPLATEGVSPCYFLLENNKGQQLMNQLFQRHQELAKTLDVDALCFHAAEMGHVAVIAELARHKANLNTANRDGTTPAYMAAYKGHVAVIRELARHKADLDKADKDGATPAYIAAERGDATVIAELAKHNANLDAANKNGATPAYMAAQNGHAQVIAELAKHNANLDAANKNGATPAYMAAYQGHVAVIAELAKRNANLDAANKNGATPAYMAAQMGHDSVIAELARHKASLDTANKNGSTPAYIAAQMGHVTVIAELARHKASLDTATHDGIIPAYAAAYNGHAAVIAELAKHNANLNVAADDGETPAYIAAQKGHVAVIAELAKHKVNLDSATHDGATPAHIAAQEGHVPVIAELAKHKANLDSATHEGATPAYIAAQNGHALIIAELAKHNANLDAATKSGATPAYIAAQNGHAAAIAELGRHNANLNVANDDCATPAYMAAYKGHVAVIAELAKHDVNFNTLSNGKTCAFIAAQKGYINILIELKKSGADFSLPYTTSESELQKWATPMGSEVLERMNAFILKQSSSSDQDQRFSLSPYDIARIMGYEEVSALLLSYKTGDKAWSESAIASSQGFFSNTPQNVIARPLILKSSF